MSRIKLYPPAGGDPVIPHPAKVEEMKAKGYTEKDPKAKQPKKAEEK